MNFLTTTKDSLPPGKLTYVASDYSFNTEPSGNAVDFEIIINMLALQVVDEKLTEVWGLCPHTSWVSSHVLPPTRIANGEITVDGEPESGNNISLTKDADWPVRVNKLEGWVVIGNAESNGKALEFMHGAVAVIEDQKLVALWLKPEQLPKLD